MKDYKMTDAKTIDTSPEHILYMAANALRREKRRMDKLSARGAEMTPQNNTQAQFEKANSNLNWQSMEVTKAEYIAHAAAVDAGIADVRETSYYETIEFNPSPFHRYNYSPPKPKIR